MIKAYYQSNHLGLCGEVDEEEEEHALLLNGVECKARRHFLCFLAYKLQKQHCSEDDKPEISGDGN